MLSGDTCEYVFASCYYYVPTSEFLTYGCLFASSILMLMIKGETLQSISGLIKGNKLILLMERCICIIDTYTHLQTLLSVTEAERRSLLLRRSETDP